MNRRGGQAAGGSGPAQRHDSSASITPAKSDTPPKYPLMRTCTNCAKAKVRCEMLRGSQSCDRCIRLKRDCQFRESRRRQNVAKKDDRLEILEAKLEKMMSLSTKEARVSPETNSSANSQPQSFAPAGHDTRPDPPVFGIQTPASDVIDAGILTFSTAERLLDIYKTKMMLHFPFVIVDHDVTVQQLRERKPFLLLAILAAASFHDPALQQVLGREVRQHVCNRMVVLGDVDLNLLQGLLIYLAWFQYSSIKGRNIQFSQFLHIATSIIVDLRLEKPPESRFWVAKSVVRTPSNELKNRSGESSFEEMRAVVGCYYLSSSSTMVLDKSGTMMCSTYMKECCKTISERCQYDTDLHLVHIVKLQQTLEDLDFHYKKEDLNLESSNLALQSKIIAVRSQLEKFREELPFPLTESPIIAFQFYTIELYLCEVSLNTSNHTNISTSVQLPSQDILRGGLDTITSFLAYYLSMPSQDELLWNQSEWLQVAYVLTATSRLCVSAQIWHAHSPNSLCANTIRLIEAVDMSLILKQDLRRKSTLISDFVDKIGDRDVFFYYVRYISNILEWYESHAYPRNDPNAAPNFLNSLMNQDLGPVNMAVRGDGGTPADSNNDGDVTAQPSSSLYPAPYPRLIPRVAIQHAGLDPGTDFSQESLGMMEPSLNDILADIDMDMGMAGWSSYPWH